MRFPSHAVHKEKTLRPVLGGRDGRGPMTPEGPWVYEYMYVQYLYFDLAQLVSVFIDQPRHLGFTPRPFVPARRLRRLVFGTSHDLVWPLSSTLDISSLSPSAATAVALRKVEKEQHYRMEEMVGVSWSGIKRAAIRSVGITEAVQFIRA
jgi:hypothetical protein